MTTTVTEPHAALACHLDALTPRQRERHGRPWERARWIASEPLLTGGSDALAFLAEHRLPA